MFKVRLLISYDGTNYVGWQRQPKFDNSIQKTLEEILSKIFNTPINVTASGRTDSGVHATRQICHFKCPRDPRSFPLVRALQSMTPYDITIHKAWVVPDDFHSIFSAEEKTYRYYVLNRTRPSSFFNIYSWWKDKPLDIDWLNKASSYLIGEHDFKSFQSRGTPVKTTIRKVHDAKWTHGKNGLLVFTIRGEGFLKQMVRNIVGTIVDTERLGKDVMQKLDRKAAGPTAPPQGLFLVNVKYPREIEEQCNLIPS
jgi:tRNA pseudouridine38-40 synthase